MATAPGLSKSFITPNPSLPAKVVSTPPNQTLYVKNLPSSKVHKSDLRMALYMLFSTYGAVLDVVAMKHDGMRGQAHIVYRDMHTATQAMRSLDKFEFMGRPLEIRYAKGKSHIISKLDGTFKLPSKSGATAVEVTELQQSIFNAPAPGTSFPVTHAGASVGADALTTTGLPPKPATKEEDIRGQKRPRPDEEEEEDEDSDVAMEQDSDDE